MSYSFPQINNEAFSDRLKKLCTRRGWSETVLAEKLSISAQAVSKWMTGKSLPDMQHTYDISILFGVSLDYLIKGKPALKTGTMAENRFFERMYRYYESFSLLMAKEA